MVLLVGLVLGLVLLLGGAYFSLWWVVVKPERDFQKAVEAGFETDQMYWNRVYREWRELQADTPRWVQYNADLLNKIGFHV